MPTYTYACTDCDEQLEVVQSFTSDPLTECPRCGGRLRKVFHPVGVVFKGSGFYRTDSRKGTGRSSSTSDAGSAAKTGATASEGSSTQASKASGESGSSAGSSGGTTPDSSEASSKGSSGSATPTTATSG